MVGESLLPFYATSYIYELSSTTYLKYEYVNDLALAHVVENWQALEEALSKNMRIPAAYFQKSRLKLNEAKIVFSALLFCAESTYFY